METVPARSFRPIAGITVAAVLGAVGIIWSIAVLVRDTSGVPSATRIALFNLFPALQTLGSLANPLGLLGNTLLLIGALLSLAYHPQGERIVRITSVSMLFAITLFTLASFVIVRTSDHWATLDPVTTGGIIGGIIGGTVGGMFQWGLMLFLFRRSPPLKEAAYPTASRSGNFTAAPSADFPSKHRLNWVGIYALLGMLILISALITAASLIVTPRSPKAPAPITASFPTVAPTPIVEPTSTPHRDEFTAAIHRADDWAFTQKLEADLNYIKQLGTPTPAPTDPAAGSWLRVLAQYPNIDKDGSPEHDFLQARIDEVQRNNSGFFQYVNWPEMLASRYAEQLSALPGVKPKFATAKSKKLEIQFVKWAQIASGRWTIVSVGGRNANGTLWSLSEREAIDGYLSGKYAFSISTKKGVAKVYPTVEYEDGSVALHVQGDTDKYFFLMQLPDFPGR